MNTCVEMINEPALQEMLYCMLLRDGLKAKTGKYSPVYIRGKWRNSDVLFVQN
jgi:hypothetical protein